MQSNAGNLGGGGGFGREQVLAAIANARPYRKQLQLSPGGMVKRRTSHILKQKYLIYTVANDLPDAIEFFQEWGIVPDYAATYNDKPAKSLKNTIWIPEKEIPSFPDCEIVVWRTVETKYLESQFAFKLSCMGIYAFSSKQIRWQKKYPWNYEPRIIEERLPDIVRLYNLFEDDFSRETCIAQIKNRLMDSLNYPPFAPWPEYHHPDCKAEQGDIVLEAGLANGDTAFTFADRCGKDGHVYGFEADPLNCPAIKEAIKTRECKNMTLVEKGVWSENSKVYFLGEKGGSSKIVPEGTPNAVEVPVQTIDSFCEENNVRKIDVIKMDIEGAEMNALQGAVNTIKKFRPKLMISAYHRPNDLFDIPFFIDDLDLNYKLYLGCHTCLKTEMDIYATPRE